MNCAAVGPLLWLAVCANKGTTENGPPPKRGAATVNSPSLHTLWYVPRPLLTYAGPKSSPTTICQPPEEEADVAPLAQAFQPNAAAIPLLH